MSSLFLCLTEKQKFEYLDRGLKPIHIRAQCIRILNESRMTQRIYNFHNEMSKITYRLLAWCKFTLTKEAIECGQHALTWLCTWIHIHMQIINIAHRLSGITTGLKPAVTIPAKKNKK